MKKKGFTLIELLAVIIILAIIALIATPVVLNLIEKMRIKAAESSAKGYTKAVEYGIMNDGYFNNISFDGEYDVENNELSISYQGDGPSKGVLDTVIGGDNDSSGYYLDYNSSGDKIIVVPVGGSNDNSNPSNPSNPSIEIDHNYTMTSIVGTTDTEAPTCELYYVVPVSNGIRASFSCTDNSGAPIVRSLFDSTTEKSAATFDTIGTLKSGSVSGNTKTVISTWNVNNPISIPTPGTCYYFRYGAQDSEGNFSTYVTNICYTGFSN